VRLSAFKRRFSIAPTRLERRSEGQSDTIPHRTFQRRLSSEQWFDTSEVQHFRRVPWFTTSGTKSISRVAANSGTERRAEVVAPARSGEPRWWIATIIANRFREERDHALGDARPLGVVG
jgi:hypothetical protein